jgi:hypothetical protein
VCEPELKKTPAISRVVQKRHSDHQHQWPAVERRLLRKWNQTAEERLATAQERKEERRNRTTYRSAPHHASSSSMSCLAAIGVGSAFQRALEEERNSWLMNGMTVTGVERAMAEHFKTMAAHEATRKILEEAKRMQRLYDQLDPLRLMRDLAI